MPLLPPLLVVLASVAAGLYLGVRFLQGRRGHAGIIGLHLILGVAGLEVLAILVRQVDGDLSSLARATLFLLVLAIFLGLLMSIIARQAPRGLSGIVLGLHALAGLGGAASLLVWALRS